jgi:peptide/nickel transport system substrate-binding protein
MARTLSSVRWVLILTLVALVVGVLACGGGRTETAAPAPKPAQPAAQPAAAPAAPAPAQKPEPAKAAVPAAPEPKYGGVALFGIGADPPGGWDIMRAALFYNLHAVGATMWGSGNLVRPCRDEVYKVCPGLAERWEANSDFTQWTFKVRDGVVWHDGTPFAAEDVKWWLDLAMFGTKVGEKTRQPAWYQSDFGPIQKVEVLDGNRIRVTLAQREPLLVERMAVPHLTISLPRHKAQPRINEGVMDIAPLDLGLVGTGPFKFLNYEKGVKAQVRRFDKYWEKDEKGRQLPILDGIDWAVFLDPASFDAAFRTGKVDGGGAFPNVWLSPQRKDAFVKDLGDKVWFAEIASPGHADFSFNVLKQGPWQDVRVRRAMSLQVDRNESACAVWDCAAFLTPMLAPKNPFTSPDFLTWPGWNSQTKQADRAEAKRLLAEAGFPQGFSFSMPCSADRGAFQRRCEFLQAQFSQLGIDMKFDLLDNAGFAATRTSNQYPAQIGYAPSSHLPEGLERGMTVHSVSPATNAKHEDPKIPEFFRRLKAATSFDERVKIYRELERYYVLDQVYAIQMTSSIFIIPYRSHVKGRVVPGEHPMNLLDFATVWLDK